MPTRRPGRTLCIQEQRNRRHFSPDPSGWGRLHDVGERLLTACFRLSRSISLGTWIIDVKQSCLAGPTHTARDQISTRLLGLGYQASALGVVSAIVRWGSASGDVGPQPHARGRRACASRHSRSQDSGRRS
ncbi:hypothetical protein N657DRAFT_373957 [Parathielavia appendiculata]|uniref:Uncharacterized protein n=1 Tax=Parathielavia appendiculata TaxID=2587402 RepID=A0AAN6YY33_9PEZI|nr:hypothetical protein N657DRAFT_373957 [Parathielavia appendiculata]